MTDNQVVGAAIGAVSAVGLAVLGWVKGWFKKLGADGARVHESDNRYNLDAAKMFSDRLVAVEQELRLSKIGFEDEIAQAKVREDACEAKYTALALDNSVKGQRITQLEEQNAGQAAQILQLKSEMGELWVKVGEIEKPK